MMPVSRIANGVLADDPGLILMEQLITGAVDI